MIVKKIPILQGFPGFETVKNLSNQRIKLSDNSLIFYDIETTGLNRKTSFVYLIGAIRYEREHWVLYQWMCEDRNEESVILHEFRDFLINVEYIVQYNGNRFDQPYLEERYKNNEIPSPFENRIPIDLYQLLKPYQAFLKLDQMKQPNLEAFLGLQKRKYCDGADCIRIYKEYIKTHDKSAAETVLGHNQEDLMGLGRIFEMLAYKNFFEGGYEPLSCMIQDEEVIFELGFRDGVPVDVSCGGKGLYLALSGCRAKILVHLKDGKLKQYYSNYKDYDYIPSEDMAVPKSVSCYMDKSLRKTAGPENCYTWFTCSEGFASDEKKQMQYLTHLLPFFLNVCSKQKNPDRN